MRRILTFIVAASVSCPPVVVASGGGRVVWIEQGRCIDPAVDQIWLQVVAMVTTVHKGWFTADRTAGALIETTVGGATRGRTDRVVFPRMIEVSVEDYDGGRAVALPVHYNLLAGFALNDGDTRYTSLGFDVSVIGRRERGPWGAALQALVDLTRTFSLPSALFGEFKLFAAYASSAVEKTLGDDGATTRSGLVEMPFAPTGACGASDTFGRTGTIVVVQESGEAPGPGVADLRALDRYCWRVRVTPDWGIDIAPRTGDACGTFEGLRNDHVGFFLNAVATTRLSTSADRGPQTVDREAAVARCATNGVGAADCLRTTPFP